jgi:DNA (cytosine-5)-methyltransferase 1
LDLFCGAGGAAMGYHRAGFDVVGVDIKARPSYPFQMVRADALQALETWDLSQFTAIHASPPCLAYSVCTAVHARSRHPDLLPQTREALKLTGLPWVIENVPGAPMRADYRLCGCMFGLPRLKRDRWFETSWHGFDFRPPCGRHRNTVIVTDGGRGVTLAEQRAAMGIDWMTRSELALAVPPAYTEYIGLQLQVECSTRVGG